MNQLLVKHLIQGIIRQYISWETPCRVMCSMCRVLHRAYTVRGVETGPVHHQQLDHLESVYSHSVVHRCVSVLQCGRKTDFHHCLSASLKTTIVWSRLSQISKLNVSVRRLDICALCCLAVLSLLCLWRWHLLHSEWDAQHTHSVLFSQRHGGECCATEGKRGFHLLN